MPVFDPAIFDPVVFDTVAAPVEYPKVECRIAWRPDQFNLVTNPGFETNTSGWSVSAGINGAGTSITRITTDFHGGAACGQLVCPATALTGVNWDFGSQPFFANATYFSVYRFVVWLKSTSGTTLARLIVGSEGTSADRASKDILLTTEWRPYFIDWAPTATETDVQLAIVNIPAVAMTVKIDDVAVYLRHAHTQVENGYFTTDTAGYSVSAGINAAGTSITRQTSGGFYGSTCGRLVTTATSGSGMNWDLGARKFTQGRTYRARVYLKSISGTTSARLRLGSLGTGADRGDASITLTTQWVAYTVDWTPSADRTDAELAVSNGTAAIMTADSDGIEIYEAIDDISADAFGQNGGANLTFFRGAAFDGSAQAIGDATVRVVNTSGKYTKENGSGALYGLLTAGKRVLIRATHARVPYPLFYGLVKRFVPLPMDYTCEILCDDVQGELERAKTNREHRQKAPATAKAETLAAAVIYNYSSERGPVEELTSFTGTDKRSVLDYITELEAATGGVHFIKPSIYASLGWQIVFRDRTVHSDASTPSETWNDDLSSMSGYDVTDEALVNRQRVAVTAYRTGFFNEVAQGYDPPTHSLIDDNDGKFYPAGLINVTLPPDELPITIPANSRRVLHFEFEPMMAPRTSITYASGSATKTEEYGATYYTLTLDGGSSDAVISGLTLSGYPLYRLPINDAEESDEESVWLDGDHDGEPVSSTYVAHPAHAAGLARWEVWRRNRSRARPTVLRHNLFVSQLSREVTDRVTLNFGRLSISGKVFAILSFSTSVSEGGHSWETTYQLEELPATPAGGWFKLDVSALDSSAVLAY